MMDIVERLRMHNDERLYEAVDVLMSEAADELAELRAFKAACERQDAVAWTTRDHMNAMENDHSHYILGRKPCFVRPSGNDIPLYIHPDPDVAHLRMLVEELDELRAFKAACDGQEAVAFMTYKGCLLHAVDPKVSEHSNPEPLYLHPDPETAKLRLQVAKLTEQRDMACEGQEEVAEVYGQCASGFTDVIDLTREKLKRKEKLYRRPDPEAAQLRVRVAELEAQLGAAGGRGKTFTQYIARVQELEAQATKLTEQNKLAAEALYKLARLGSGDLYGNSEGNVIAQQALAAIRSSEVLK
jgi:hypothetical protein